MGLIDTWTLTDSEQRSFFLNSAHFFLPPFPQPLVRGLRETVYVVAGQYRFAPGLLTN